MKTFLASKGDDFGKPTDVTSILYNGPYLLKGLTSKSSIEMTKIKTTGINKMSLLMISSYPSLMVKMQTP